MFHHALGLHTPISYPSPHPAVTSWVRLTVASALCLCRKVSDAFSCVESRPQEDKHRVSQQWFPNMAAQGNNVNLSSTQKSSLPLRHGDNTLSIGMRVLETSQGFQSIIRVQKQKEE